MLLTSAAGEQPLPLVLSFCLLRILQFIKVEPIRTELVLKRFIHEPFLERSGSEGPCLDSSLTQDISLFLVDILPTGVVLKM